MAPQPEERPISGDETNNDQKEKQRSSISMNVGRMSLLPTPSASAGVAGMGGFAWWMGSTRHQDQEPGGRPIISSTRTSMVTAAPSNHSHVVTPTANDTVTVTATATSTSATSSQSSRPSLPPAMILQRQNSDLSAWVSEVDSHYHSRAEGFESDSDIESDNDENLRQRDDLVQSARIALARTNAGANASDRRDTSLVPLSVAVAVTPREDEQPHTASRHHEQQHPTRAFVVASQAQSGGDDTSEGTGGPRYYIASRKGAKGISTETHDPSPVFLQVLQQRASQAEQRASSLTHRLALEERLHRQVAEDLREAKWEASNLQDQVREQEARIHELEQQRRITEEWNARRTTETVTIDRSHTELASASKDTENKRKLAKANAEQEDAQKRIKELIRDLKRSQDKLLRVEVQKRQLLQELANLQATHQVAVAEASTPRDDSQQEQQEALRIEINQVQAQLLELRASKLAVETRLQDSLAKELELHQSLEQSNQDLEDLRYEHEKICSTNESLKKRVRFADEQRKVQEERYAQVEARHSRLQQDLQEANEAHKKEIGTLQSCLKQVTREKEETLEKIMSIQMQLEHLQDFSRKEQLAMEDISLQLQTERAAKADLEVSFQKQLGEQKAVVMLEQGKAAKQRGEWEQRLHETMEKVTSLQQTLELSQGNRERIQNERESVSQRNAILEKRIAEKELELERLHVERSFLMETLEQLQEANATAAIASENKAVEVVVLERKLQEATSQAAAQQVQALKEREALQRQLKEQDSMMTQLEQKMTQLEQNLNKLNQEKEELILQAAELKTALLAEKRMHAEELATSREEQDRLKSEVQSMEEERDELNDRLKCWESRVVDLEEQVEQAVAQQEPLQSQVEAATSRVKTLEDSLDTAEANVTKLQTEQEELRQNHSELQHAHAESVAKVAALQVSKQDSRNVIEALEAARQLLQEKVNLFQMSNSDMTSKVEEAEARRKEMAKLLSASQDKLTADLFEARAEINLLKEAALAGKMREDSQTASHSEALQALKSQNKERLDDLRASMHVLLNDQKAKAIDELSKQIEETRLALQEVEDKLAQEMKKSAHLASELEKEKRQNKIFASQVEHSTQTILTVTGNLETAKAEVEWLKTEHVTLSRVHAELEARLIETTSERDALVLELHAARSENKDLMAKLEILKTENSDLEAKLTLAYARSAELEASASESQQQLLAFRSVGQEKQQVLERELWLLKNQKATVEIELSCANEAMAGLQANLVETRSEADAAHNHAEMLRAKQTVLLGEVKALTEQAEVLTANRDLLASEKNFIEKALNDLQLDHAEIKSDREQTKAEIEALTAEKEALEQKFGQTIHSLAQVEKELAISKEETEKAKKERDAALLRKSELEGTHDEVWNKMQNLQADYDQLVSDKLALTQKNTDLTDEMEARMREFRNLKLANEELLLKYADVESRNAVLNSQMESLEARRKDLEVQNESLGTEKRGLQIENNEAMQALDRESVQLRDAIALLEREKAAIAGELATSMARIAQLETRVNEMEQDAQNSSKRYDKLLKDLAALKEDKDTLRTLVSDFEMQVHVLREDLRIAKAAVEEAESTLCHTQNEMSALASEKSAAISRQHELEKIVSERAAELSSLESLSSDLQEQLRVMSSEKDKLERDQKILASLGPSRDDEVKYLSKAVSSAATTISELQRENDLMASRLSSAEAAVAALKGEISENEGKSNIMLRKLGLQVLEDYREHKKISAELRACKKNNTGLKRVARFLVKRIRELEGQAGLVNQSIDLPFSLTSTPDSKSTLRSDLDRSLFSKDDSDDGPDSELDTTESSARANKKEITLQLHYHDHSGELVTYDVKCKYTGPMLKHVPHGPGMLRFDNGDMFLGEFKNGEMDGVGAFAHRQRRRHANQVFCGKFSSNEFQGDVTKVPPISRVSVQRQSGKRLARVLNDSLAENALGPRQSSLEL